MDNNFKKKYYGFVCAYITNGKICMSTKMKNKYGEDFFDTAVKDGILREIEKNDLGQRQFKFTQSAKDLM